MTFELSQRNWVILPSDDTTPSGKTLFMCTCCGRISAFPDKTCPLLACNLGSMYHVSRGIPLLLDDNQFQAVFDALTQYVENSEDCDDPAKDAPLLPHARRIMIRMRAAMEQLAEQDDEAEG